MRTFFHCCIAINLRRMDFDKRKGLRLIDEFGGPSNCVLASIFEGEGSPSNYLYVISKSDKDDFYDFAHSSGEFKGPLIIEFTEVSNSRLA